MPVLVERNGSNFALKFRGSTPKYGACYSGEHSVTVKPDGTIEITLTNVTGKISFHESLAYCDDVVMPQAISGVHRVPPEESDHEERTAQKEK